VFSEASAWAGEGREDQRDVKNGMTSFINGRNSNSNRNRSRIRSHWHVHTEYQKAPS
jgi:hypothetical protein